MLWFTFMSSDVYQYLNPSFIRNIEEIGDRLTVTFSDGKVTVYDNVFVVEWIDNPQLTYWRECGDDDIPESPAPTNRLVRLRRAILPDPVASDM